MAEQKRLTVLLSPEEHAKLKRKAGLVPLSTWLREQGLRASLSVYGPDSAGRRGAAEVETYVPVEQKDEVGEGQGVLGDRGVPVGTGGAGASQRVSEPDAGISRADQEVSRRTG